MGDDGSIITRSSGNTAAVSGLFFQAGHNGTLGHLTDRHHVANSQLSLLAAIDELTGVHAFSGNEELLAGLVAIGIPNGFITNVNHYLIINWPLVMRAQILGIGIIPEVNNGEWSTTSRIVDDVFDDTLDITISFGIINSSEPGRSLPIFGVSDKNRSGSFTLCADDTTHLISRFFLRTRF